MKPDIRRTGILRGVLALALSASMLSAVDTSPAHAERRNLLEQWFPNAKVRKNGRRPLIELFDRNRNQRQQIEPEQQRVAAPIKKVTGPSYYSYKTEGLATLKLAGVIAALDAITDRIPASGPADGTGEPADAIQPVDGGAAPKIGDKAELGNGAAGDRGIDPLSTGSVDGQPWLTSQALENLSLEAEAGIAKAVTDHYAANPKYLWVTPGMKPNAKARGLLRYLADAGKYGLDPADYDVGESADAEGSTFGAQQAARFEFLLSIAAVRYAADADKGRVDPNKISGYHDFPKWSRDYSGYMKQIAQANVPVLALAKLQPSHPRFAALVNELAELEGSANADTPEPPAAGTFIKPGQTSEELPKVIAGIAWKSSNEFKVNHAMVFAAAATTTVYDEPVVEMVRDFQKEHGLKPDGIVGRNTLAKLTVVSDAAKAEKVRLAMERLRWHPDNFGSTHVFINQAAYQASYVVNNHDQLSMRVIVGKPSNQTTFFHDTIELVEFNPYWNVPRSILVNEMLGSVRSDPGYFEARGYEVVSHGGGVVSGYSVDWWSEDASKKYYVRQKPGAKNALGELKILFPNKHDIYMHDTPSRGLFQRSARALSHGCVRLSDPRAMAAAVLGTSKDKIGNYIAGGQNQSIAVKNKIPVYVSYFTAWPDEDGTVRYYGDIYGRDGYLEKAMEKTSELRKQALASG